MDAGLCNRRAAPDGRKVRVGAFADEGKAWDAMIAALKAKARKGA